MTLFQILALGLIVSLLVVTIAAGLKGWTSRRETVAWASVWLCAGVAIYWPEVTAVIARKLGIGRGADLLLYCSVVATMVGFLMIYTRLRRLRRELTLLVREIAIRDAVENSPTASRQGDRTVEPAK